MNFEEIYKISSPFTITNYQRMRSLYDSVVYLNDNGIEGSFVECGVYKGGSVMNMALTQLNYPKMVHIYLYDTFEGMTPEGEYDINYEGIPASKILKNKNKLCICSLDEVQKNLSLTGYPREFLHYRMGDIATTLKQDLPPNIALLRLDTDWYESTKIGLEVLYPKLVEGGVLILDDYGYWKGARKAVDDYFKSVGINPNFESIEHGMGAVKHTKGINRDRLIRLQRTTIDPTKYLNILEAEYNELKKFLPEKIDTVLDIGCGLGGIDIFFYRDYKSEITLLDRDGVDDKVEYGYRTKPNKYNLLSETKKFVESQGVKGANFVNVDREPFPQQEFDLTLSLFAMGYHFPFDTYKPNTRYLIADIRDGIDPPKGSKIIAKGKNHKRILWQNS